MDIELVVRAQHGDRAAFAAIAAAVYPRLHRVAFQVLGDTHLAEDVTQGAMLRVWRYLPRLRDPARFEGWAYRTVVHACRTEARRGRRWLPSTLMTDDLETRGADELRRVIDRDQLERGFRRLSVDQRAVVVLHHDIGLPIDRVAVVLGIPVGTAHSRLHRAMELLRAALDADARPATVPNATKEARR